MPYNRMIVYRVFIIFAYLLSAFAFIGCGSKDEHMLKIIVERDSLRNQNAIQKQELSDINGMISTINEAFDSIAIAEGMLFGDSHSEVSPSRNSILQNLEKFEQVLQRQHDKINALEAMISVNKASEGMQGLVEHMKEQLADKDMQLSLLRKELSSRNVDISRLRRQVASQRSKMAEQDTKINELGKKMQQQATALARQDQELNNGYILIGTKAELKRLGVAKRRKIINDGLRDVSKFTKIDIRKMKELSFKAKKPRILTNMPQSSYSLTETSKGTYTLVISNPTVFWSASNFLVIQTN